MFKSQGLAIIAAMSNYDRKEKGIKVYMDGHLEILLSKFGTCGAGIADWWDNLHIEMSDSLCVLQASTNDVSNDTKTGRVLGEILLPEHVQCCFPISLLKTIVSDFRQ